MTTSSVYESLKNRINQLENDLLPVIDPLLQYSEKDLDLTSAFYLLCHAEIENYIEKIIERVAEDAYTRWEKNKTNITPIIFNLAFSFFQDINKPKEHPYSMVCISYKNLIKTIKNNHGIKERNIDGLLHYIGFEMDPTLKTTLNDYGSKRGKLAHQSHDPQSPPDPSVAKNEIQQILNGLANFDIEIIQYGLNGVTNQLPVHLHWKQRMYFWENLKGLFRKAFKLVL